MIQTTKELALELLKYPDGSKLNFVCSDSKDSRYDSIKVVYSNSAPSMIVLELSKPDEEGI